MFLLLLPRTTRRKLDPALIPPVCYSVHRMVLHYSIGLLNLPKNNPPCNEPHSPPASLPANFWKSDREMHPLKLNLMLHMCSLSVSDALNLSCQAFWGGLNDLLFKGSPSWHSSPVILGCLADIVVLSPFPGRRCFRLSGILFPPQQQNNVRSESLQSRAGLHKYWLPVTHTL